MFTKFSVIVYCIVTISGLVVVITRIDALLLSNNNNKPHHVAVQVRDRRPPVKIYSLPVGMGTSSTVRNG